MDNFQIAQCLTGIHALSTCARVTEENQALRAKRIKVMEDYLADLQAFIDKAPHSTVARLLTAHKEEVRRDLDQVCNAPRDLDPVMASDLIAICYGQAASSDTGSMDCDDAARIYGDQTGVAMSELQLHAWRKRYNYEFGVDSDNVDYDF